ncbi:hypothetical protein N0V83_010432 [Neocucurbitaria cava]|uniref:Xylanolytic transcriptional activator regulatory domain-containing protein n=1 Tax=Neocucurbitaria cava TaxID=798079 RepID=A0A9W9CHB8_9PLEO|nr:hypothetical protein N0V83_010432 [Neocucurbitaria cava]
MRSRYLTSVEKRLHSLEALVSQLLPGVNVDDVLLSTLAPNLASNTTPPPTNLPATEVSQANVVSSPQGSSSSIVNDPVLPEAVPNSADGFNWQEENVAVDVLTDGMAALSVEPTGVGYLGSTSGVVFLRCLLDWAGFLTGAQAQTRNTEPSTHFGGLLASSQISHAALTIQISSTLIDAYFHDYHVCYPFVHEATFRAQYHEIVPRPPRRSWDMLYNAILALGAWCLNHDQIGLEDYLYRRALTLGQHESVFEAANLTSVQALTLLSNLSQKRNSPNTGWNLLGLAVRTAASLALHRELPHWNISLLEREIRRRVWWGLYIFDSGASTTFGRAIMLPDLDSMNVHPVLNIDDESLTPNTTELPLESSEPTLYSSLHSQSQFHVYTNYISNRLLADPGLSAEAALGLNASMEAWTHTLPPYLQISQGPSCQVRWYLFARSRIWWRFWNLKIIVFRHILLRRAISERGQIPDQATQSNQEDCKRMCLEAAHATVVSIHQYSTQGLTLTRLEGWYATFPHANEVQSWYEDVRLARTTFREHLIEDSLSARCVAILDQVISDDDMNGDLFQDLTLDKDALSTFPWSVESNELFNSFDWDLNTSNF